MKKSELIKDRKDMLFMICNNYGVLNYFQIELLEDTLKDCLLFIKEVKN